MKKVKNKQQIQSIIYYLIKWADWSSEYNFYKFMSHLADAFKVITDYKQKLKHKHKKTDQINIDKVSDSKNVSCVKMRSHALFNTQCTEWDFKVTCFHFKCSRISTDFWMNYTTLHSVSYSFYFQLQLAHQTVEFHCVKSEKYFNENWY